MDTGWNSGSCSTPGDDDRGIPWLGSADPLGVHHPRRAVAHPGSTAPYWWLIEGHLPTRPGWDCRECETRWPCESARSVLERSLSRRTLSMVMAEWMQMAAGELTTIKAGELFDRFLIWTRQEDRPSG